MLSLVACGDDSTAGGEPSAPSETSTPATTVPAPFVALRHQSDGGCQVMGPNCPTYVIWSDGRVEVQRTGKEDDGVVLTGSIPVADVTAWLDAVRDLDPVELAAQVGPGSCQSCVDGADVVVVTTTGRGEVTLDSTKMAFDPAHPVFAALERLTTDVLAIGQLPIVTIP